MFDRRTPLSRGSIHSEVDIMAKSLKSSALTSDLDSKAAQQYDPFDGFYIYFDYLSKMFKLFESARLVFSVHKVAQTIFDPIISGRTEAITDPTD